MLVEPPTEMAEHRKLPFERILITGASGFVGRWLVPALNERLRPAARLFLGGRSDQPAAEHGHTAVFFDLENPASVVAAVEAIRPDLILHLAGQASVGRSVDTAAVTWSSNLCGSLALARAVAEIVPNATMLFTSSVEVYGLTFNHEIVTEQSPLRPQSAYARSKAATEMMLSDVLPTTVRLIVARPCNHSGPGQDSAYVIPSFATQIALVEGGYSSEIRVGNLDAERDFLDVRDVVEAYLALLARADKLPSRTIFNIASGNSIAIPTVLERLCALSDRPIAVLRDPARLRPSDVSRAAIDASAIRAEVGWSPIYSLDDLLERVLADRRSV